jgi:hypothetical protein
MIKNFVITILTILLVPFVCLTIFLMILFALLSIWGIGAIIANGNVWPDGLFDLLIRIAAVVSVILSIISSPLIWGWLAEDSY